MMATKAWGQEDPGPYTLHIMEDMWMEEDDRKVNKCTCGRVGMEASEAGGV